MERLERLAQLSLGDWVCALKLDTIGILNRLDEWGVVEPADMIYLEQEEVEMLSADLKLIQRRKLEKAIEALARQAGMSPDPVVQVPPPAVVGISEGALTKDEEEPAPAPEFGAATPPDDDEFARHREVLLAHVEHGFDEAQAPAVLEAIHRCWTGCVADPARRASVLPSLFRIARENTGSDLEREAAIALVFLAFSLSGTTVDVHAAPASGGSAISVGEPTSVLILGWLGSGNADFAELVEHYQSTYGCKVMVSVGGNDLWPGHAIATTEGPGAPAPPSSGLATSMSGAAAWPASGLADAQLRQLASEMEGPRVLIHSFSNNGIMLYTRLLRYLTQEQDAQCTASPGSGRMCAASLALASICAVVIDSSPDPSYDRNLLKQVALASVASVLKKEPIAGMPLKELGIRSPLRASINAACEQASDAVFDSCWHYPWLEAHELPIPQLFMYSVVDRTIRQPAVEAWVEGRRMRMREHGRATVGDYDGDGLCETLLFERTNHVEHFWRERPRYLRAVTDFIARVF